MARWLRGHTVPHLVNTVDFSKNSTGEKQKCSRQHLKLPESLPFCFKTQARSFQIWLQSSKSFLKKTRPPNEQSIIIHVKLPHQTWHANSKIKREK